jgi:recombination protein RecR
VLAERARSGGVRELILALGASTEADSTVLLIERMLHGTPARLSRLARGIPVGSDLEFVDELTMLRAFEARERL